MAVEIGYRTFSKTSACSAASVRTFSDVFELGTSIFFFFFIFFPIQRHYVESKYRVRQTRKVNSSAGKGDSAFPFSLTGSSRNISNHRVL